ncbi:MAG TPA: efflux transporter outer membrane subunit [Terriglobia bacterium]|nr:efflux transporter outer membrane subunit [Terriglobia bacterium]
MLLLLVKRVFPEVGSWESGVGKPSPLPSADCGLPSAFCVLLSTFCLACTVGPNYKRASAPVPPAYKETAPESFKEAGDWKPAQPNDQASKGKWWEIYNDPELNALEEQVSISNQNVLMAEAQFREAEAAVRIARAGLYPTLSGSVSITNSRAPVTPSAGLGNFTPASRTTYDLPVGASWVPDLWGNIRRGVTGSMATAQASAAQLENARLSFQGELAQDYFQLRGTDGDYDLLDRTVKSYQDYLTLTQNRFNAGVASGADVAQAETQLDGARAELVDLEVTRNQLEHAIAILTGKPPLAVTVSHAPIAATQPPPVPIGVPSTLLERRPDIAAAERQMAAANEQIGIAQSAFYPTLTLSATGGLESSRLGTWIQWPSRFWSVGPQLAETLFDAGRRHAQVAQAQAAFDATIASYRQTVLNGFQQVEDDLSALRVLEKEAGVESDTVQAAELALRITTDQYKAGTVSYLQVIISQTAAFTAEKAAVDILTRRLAASVSLVQALGGGWNASQLPKASDLVSAR